MVDPADAAARVSCSSVDAAFSSHASSRANARRYPRRPVHAPPRFSQ
jgi:hypothetical protein